MYSLYFTRDSLKFNFYEEKGWKSIYWLNEDSKDSPLKFEIIRTYNSFRSVLEELAHTKRKVDKSMCPTYLISQHFYFTFDFVNLWSLFFHLKQPFCRLNRRKQIIKFKKHIKTFPLPWLYISWFYVGQLICRGVPIRCFFLV